MDRSLLTIIVPVFNEEDVLPELFDRLRATLARLGFDDAELIFVDDGSDDGSREQVSRLAGEDQRIRGIFLTRNFGHQAAVSTGLAHARGSVVCVMDGDLQDPPELLPDLVAALEAGADVALAVRRKRKEGLLKRAAYDVFYRLLAGVSDIRIPHDAGDFCCMKRPVVDAMLSLPERRRFVRGIRAWVGFRQVGVEYDRPARTLGRTKYSLRKLVALAYDGLFSFSSLPVKLMQFAGFAISGLAILVAVFYFVWYLFAPERFPQGWATLIISIWFLGGIQMLFMGLVGEYVYRTFDESRARPPALVARVVEGGQAAERRVTPSRPVDGRRETTKP